MTDQEGYSPEVVFGPIEEPMPTPDWRWQEILTLEPFKVMEELKELDTALFAARSEQKEAVRELADLEDVLYKLRQEALEAIENEDVRAKLFKGGTKDERKERQEMHLADLDWVQRSEAEIKVARERKDNAQVGLDSMLDRQVNLGKFANMYSATARLLASIRTEQKPLAEMVERMPENQFEDLLAFIAELREGEETKEAAKPIQAPPDLEPIVEDEVLDAMEVAGVEIPVEVEIPPSMDVTEEEAGPMKVAIERHRVAAEAIKRHRGEAKEEDLPFQPDEDLSL